MRRLILSVILPTSIVLLGIVIWALSPPLGLHSDCNTPNECPGPTAPAPADLAPAIDWGDPDPGPRVEQEEQELPPLPDLPPPASTPRRRLRRATTRAKVRVRRCAWVWTGCTGRATTTATGKSETAPACESCAARMVGEHGHTLRGILAALRRDPSLLKALRSILGVPNA